MYDFPHKKNTTFLNIVTEHNLSKVNDLNPFSQFEHILKERYMKMVKTCSKYNFIHTKPTFGPKQATLHCTGLNFNPFMVCNFFMFVLLVYILFNLSG